MDDPLAVVDPGAEETALAEHDAPNDDLYAASDPDATAALEVADEDVPFDPADPSHPQHAEYRAELEAELEQAQREYNELVHTVAAQAGVDPQDVFDAFEAKAMHERAQVEAFENQNALHAEEALNIHLDRLSSEHGEFDRDQARDLATRTYDLVREQYGEYVAVSNAPAILAEAAKQVAEERRETVDRLTRMNEAGSLLVPGAPYDAALSMQASVHAFPTMMERHGGDTVLAASEARRFGNYYAAAVAGGDKARDGFFVEGKLARYYAREGQNIKNDLLADPARRAEIARREGLSVDEAGPKRGPDGRFLAAEQTFDHPGDLARRYARTPIERGTRS